jgi:hypothetical protein
MDNVQKHDIYTNVPQSQTFRSYETEIPSSLIQSFIQVIDNLLIKEVRIKYLDV